MKHLSYHLKIIMACGSHAVEIYPMYR
uniref:Uncharacterized protein n=1 Tax=Anguilla anguilla TaxID=7936 RepID=A0A0E9T1V1_ANGAN